MKLKNTLFFIFILSLISSCGDQATGGTRSIASTGETFSLEIKMLDANQLNIAYRLCSSFRSKRNNWRSESVIGKTAKFSFEEKSCDEVEASATEISPDPIISAPTLSSEITFASLSSENYFVGVQTDLHGSLKNTCPIVLDNENVLEFFVETQGQRIYTVFEKINDNTDRVTLKYTRKDNSNEAFVSYKIVSFDIQTTGDDANYLGTVTETFSSTKCAADSSSNVHQTKKQTLISIL